MRKNAILIIMKVASRVHYHQLYIVGCAFVDFCHTLIQLISPPQKADAEELSSVDEKDPWWSAFTHACNKMYVLLLLQCDSNNVFTTG